jgi:hypothetical protein
MSFTPIPLNPGVYKDDTPVKSEGFFIDSDKIRFLRGLPQVFGGWELLSTTALTGVCRALHSWADINTVKWLAAGTHSNLYILTDSLPYDVTPVIARGHVSISFTTVSGSAVVTADWTAHGLVAGQAFSLANATVTTVGGVTINTPAATTSAPSPQYIVLAVNTANQITFTAAQTATSNAGPTASTVDYRQYLAPGLQNSIGALGYGTGAYSTSTYSSPGTGNVFARTWSLANYGQNLIASPRGGKIYEMAPITAASELVTNGSFTGSASGWTLGAGWAYGANAVTATASNAALSQSITLAANAFFLVSFVVSAFAAGTCAVTHGGTSITGLSAIAADGTYTGTFFSAGGAETLAFTGTGFTGTIDNVSVTQLTTAEVVPNAPTQNTLVLVTPEGFVMTFGTIEAATSNFNPMHIRWSDIGSVVKGEQTWTPGSTNLAGFVTLGVGSRIVGAKISGTEILVWTDEQFYAGTYSTNSGIVYSFRPVGSKCGLIAPNAVGILETGAYWMSPDGNIHAYSGGAPIPIKSTMSKDVFDHISLSQQDKITAWTISKFSEVIWLYPDSRDGNECSRYTLLDTAEALSPLRGTNPGIVGCFAAGTFDRTVGINAGVLPYPVAADSSGYLYIHEKGNTANGAAINWYLETGAVQIGTGATLFKVNSFYPDFSGLLGGATLTASAYKYPQSSAIATGPFNFTSASEKIDMLGGPPIGREVSFLFEGNSSPAFMRTGKLMMDIEDTGMAF